MNSNFEIIETFKITNHGIVLLGSFLSENAFQTIMSGDKISFLFEN